MSRLFHHLNDVSSSTIKYRSIKLSANEPDFIKDQGTEVMEVAVAFSPLKSKKVARSISGVISIRHAVKQ